MFHSTPGYLAFAFPVGYERIVTWQSVAAGRRGRVGGRGHRGALAGARRSSPGPLQTAMRLRDPRRVWIAARLAAGVVCLLPDDIHLVRRYACGRGWERRARRRARLPAAVSVRWARVAVRACRQRSLDGVASALAVTELRTPQSRVRSLAIAATAAVAVFGVVEFQGVGTNLTRGLEASIRGIDSSADDMGDTEREIRAFSQRRPFTAVDTAALARVPGVSRLGVYRGSFLDWGERRLWVLAPAARSRIPSRRASSSAAISQLASARSPPGWLGGALPGARLRTPPPRRARRSRCPRHDHINLAGRGFDDEPRLATGRDHPQLEQLCASMGEQRPERIRDPDQPRASRRDCAQSGSQRVELRTRPGGGNHIRTRAAPLRRRGSGALAADADPAARADRRWCSPLVGRDRLR